MEKQQKNHLTLPIRAIMARPAVNVCKVEIEGMDELQVIRTKSSLNKLKYTTLQSQRHANDKINVHTVTIPSESIKGTFPSPG